MEGRRSVALSSPPPALCRLCLASVTTLIKCQAQAGAICCEHASGSPEEKLLKLLPGIGSGGPLGKTGRDSMEKGNKKGDPNPKGKGAERPRKKQGTWPRGRNWAPVVCATGVGPTHVWGPRSPICLPPESLTLGGPYPGSTRV